MSSRITNFLRALPAGLMMMAGTAQAGTASATLTVEVTVIAEPCIINNNSPIVVDFGNSVLTNKVDSGIYTKAVNYTLDCTDATADTLNMTITGTGAGFDNSVLQASQANLGIKLLKDGTDLPLNTAVAFNRDKKPVLQAQLVKAPTGALTAGAFTATAILAVSYQ
ncbi:TPA: fimbrial protein [Klebsiella aerogenes]|nr:fimbrial protein [Klebsiella aerogenes]